MKKDNNDLEEIKPKKKESSWKKRDRIVTAITISIIALLAIAYFIYCLVNKSFVITFPLW